MDISTASEELVDQAERFATFTGIIKPNPDDRFFLVMGETGSGKSTFISRCTGKSVPVGDSLHSRPTLIDISDYEWRGRRVYLIDTPGFHDMSRSDSETLEILASYLGASYANGVRIHGVVFLHSITDNRIAGSDIWNIQVLKAMCDFSSYANLLIATTMWPPDLSVNDKAFLLNRETHLTITRKYFAWFFTRGAAVARHNEQGHRDDWTEMESARNIVSYLIEQAENYSPEPLLLQRELIDEGKSLLDTTAGFAINAKLYKVRQDHERHLREVEVGMRTELAQEDAEHAAELQELKEEVEWRLAEAIQDKKGLETSMQEMHEKEEKFWKKRIRAMEEQFLRRLELKEQRIAEMEESLSMQKAVGRQSGSGRNADELERCESALNDARSDLDQARCSYQNFSRNPSSPREETHMGTVNCVGPAAAASHMCSVM